MAQAADRKKPDNQRASGLLLHVTSLPSAYGVGDLGPEARQFVDFLAAAGQTVWQVLPLNPTDPYTGNSPYLSCSAFAGNPLLISPALLAEQGLIPRGSLDSLKLAPGPRAQFGEAWARRNSALEKAYTAFMAGGHKADFEKFCHEQSAWLDDYALFVALKRAAGGAAWNTWAAPLRGREPAALSKARRDHARQIQREQFTQYLFDMQYRALKQYAVGKGVRLFGDLPIYVGYDSADVWANPELFKLDKSLQPTAVSGVPPDYFSKTGQLWNTPVYDWKRLKRDRYRWWVQRLTCLAARFDIVRIDHFRGLVQYWEVPAGEKTAVKGAWADVPTDDLLETVRGAAPGLRIVAEDLGIITDDVREVMRRHGFPGMKVLLFAFTDDKAEHPYLPHNYTRDCVVYTGTHDNNTARGWLSGEASEFERKRFEDYVGTSPTSPDAVWELIRLAMLTVADSVVVPVQDILGLGAEARMNTPSTTSGNWEFRLTPGQLTPEIAEHLGRLTTTYGRRPRAVKQ